MADQMHLGAGGQALGQGQRVGDRAFAQRPVFEREDPLAVGRGERLAQAGAFGIGGVPQFAETAVGAGGGAVQKDQQRPLASGERCVVGNGMQPERAGQVETVEAGRVVAEQFFLEVDAERAGGFLDDIDAEEVENADRQPGHAAFATARPLRRQPGEFPGAAVIAVIRFAALAPEDRARGRRRSVFPGQVVDPAPQYEAIVQFDANHRVAGDFDFIGGAVAGAAGDQAMDRRMAADGISAAFAANAANSVQGLGHGGSSGGWWQACCLQARTLPWRADGLPTICGDCG